MENPMKCSKCNGTGLIKCPSCNGLGCEDCFLKEGSIICTDCHGKKMVNNDLTDVSPMPFGKYKGDKMEDVPASYLHWVYTSAENKHVTPVRKYIEANLSALMKEYPDGIWK